MLCRDLQDARHIGTIWAVAGFCHATEKHLEARRCHMNDHAQGRIAAIAKRMRYPARKEDGGTRRRFCPYSVLPQFYASF